MATRNALTVQIEKKTYEITWAGLLNGDTGSAEILARYSDKSIQVVGDLGVGGVCLIEGSNDGSSFFTLVDPQGNALSFSAFGLEQVLEITKFIRPRISAGDGDTDFTVILVGRDS